MGTAGEERPLPPKGAGCDGLSTEGSGDTSKLCGSGQILDLLSLDLCMQWDGIVKYPLHRAVEDLVSPSKQHLPHAYHL